MMYLHALSPIHTGTGQAVDVIDLPVAREVTTGWPYIPGSSIKGVLRSMCDPSDTGKGDIAAQRLFTDAFGPDTVNASEGAGSLLFGDGRLLCLPVRSLSGTFAWLSCPLALDRYRRDHAAAGLSAPPALAGADPADDHIVLERASSRLVDGDTVYLEDLDLTVTDGPTGALATHIAAAVFDDNAWRGHFVARFAVVSDTTFTFLAETATEVTARIRLDDTTKTVSSGALWYEEAVPIESLFSAPLLAAPRGGRAASDLFGLVGSHLGDLVQIGGHAGVGRGLVQVRLGGDSRRTGGTA